MARNGKNDPTGQAAPANDQPSVIRDLFEQKEQGATDDEACSLCSVFHAQGHPNTTQAGDVGAGAHAPSEAADLDALLDSFAPPKVSTPPTGQATPPRRPRIIRESKVKVVPFDELSNTLFDLTKVTEQLPGGDLAQTGERHIATTEYRVFTSHDQCVGFCGDVRRHRTSNNSSRALYRGDERFCYWCGKMLCPAHSRPWTNDGGVRQYCFLHWRLKAGWWCFKIVVGWVCRFIGNLVFYVFLFWAAIWTSAWVKRWLDDRRRKREFARQARHVEDLRRRENHDQDKHYEWRG